MFDDLSDGAGRLRGIVHLHDSLMQIRIKPLAQRFDASDTKALKRLEKDPKKRSLAQLRRTMEQVNRLEQLLERLAHEK